MDLRSRDKERIVEPMALMTNDEVRQRLASAGSNRCVDRVEAVGEARENFVEPFALSIGALRLRSWQLVDAPGDLCQRRCRDKQGGLFASHHSSRGLAFGVASMLKRGVSFNQVLMVSPYDTVRSRLRWERERREGPCETRRRGTGP